MWSIVEQSECIAESEQHIDLSHRILRFIEVEIVMISWVSVTMAADC